MMESDHHRTPNMIADYAAAGGKRHGFWRVVVGVLLVGLLCMLAASLVLFAVAFGVGLQSDFGHATSVVDWLITGDGPATVAFNLAAIALLWPALWVVLRLLHKQRLGTVFSPEGRIRWREFFVGAAMIVTALAIVSALAAPMGELPERRPIAFESWLVLALPLAALVFIQATAEELVFRGYITQQLALRSLNPLVWAALPSLLFGLMHWNPTLPFDTRMLYIAATFSYGLLAAATVAKTASLATAMGMHVATNLLAILVVAQEGPLAGAALYVQPDGAAASDILWNIGVSLSLLALVLSRYSPVKPRLREIRQPA